MSKALPFRCRVNACSFGEKITYADILQIRIHLIKDHDYVELRQTSYQLGLTSSELSYRSHGWFVRKVSEACIIKELESNV